LHNLIESGAEPFLLFNQQQCFIYSTASFLLKLRAKKVEKCVTRHKTVFNKFKWRLTGNYENEIPESETTISGFADSKQKLMPTYRP